MRASLKKVQRYEDDAAMIDWGPVILQCMELLFSLGYILGWPVIWLLSFGRYRPLGVSEDESKLKPLGRCRFEDEDGAVVLSRELTAVIGATIILSAALLAGVLAQP